MNRPNIILMMADDLGYGDVGFNGNQVIKTPHLDAMARSGTRFTRFYAGGPVCSPTRGTCLTGRHYSRYGITHANEGSLPVQELSLPRVLNPLAYRTGHFGKWHLGTMTATERDSRRGGPGNAAYHSPPWLHGFDSCFSTEARVPTWDPMTDPESGEPFGASYWLGPDVKETENLDGDDSRVIMDRAIPFIRSAAEAGEPFFAVVWFHTPHEPVVAGPDYRAMYSQYSEEEQHYYGCITAMDEQVGRLNRELKDLGIANDTMTWFCSDNGPEGKTGNEGRSRGSTGGLRGRKRSLFNGGITVPALLSWPDRAPAGQTVDMSCSTLDYLPTIIDALGYEMPDDRPIDGVSLLSTIQGKTTERGRPIPFRFVETEDEMFGSPTIALMDDRHKVLTNLSTDNVEDLCFDVSVDPSESADVASERLNLVNDVRKELRRWLESCRASHFGADYPDPFTPPDPFQEVTGTWPAPAADTNGQ